MATVRKHCRPADFFSMARRLCTFLPFCIQMAPTLISEGAASFTGRAVCPRRQVRCCSELYPAFVGRRAKPQAPRRSASARAPWNKWKGPARVKRWREGGRLCRERRSRSCARRYGSHEGRPMNAGEANMPTTTACHAMKPAPAVKSIEAIFITSADRRDVMGRQRPEGHSSYRHTLDTGAPRTKHVLVLSNSAKASAHPGKPSHSRRAERSSGLQDPLEHG